MQNIAAYLDAQSAESGRGQEQGHGRCSASKIYRGGIAEKGVPACASCHGATGAGIPAQYPRLAGQHQDYTLAQLAAFSSRRPQEQRADGHHRPAHVGR